LRVIVSSSKGYPSQPYRCEWGVFKLSAKVPQNVAMVKIVLPLVAIPPAGRPYLRQAGLPNLENIKQIIFDLKAS